jgi:hypothetical protein
MLDENLIATLETSLRQTRNAQNRLMARLREAETEVQHLRQEIEALENSAAQTESAIDSILVTMRAGTRPWNNPDPAPPPQPRPAQRREDFDYDYERRVRDPRRTSRPAAASEPNIDDSDNRYRTGSPGTYFTQGRVPSIGQNLEALSHRFSDLTITQACRLLLKEYGKALHVNELYNLLVSGGMEFNGNNPTISIAVSLNRNRKFCKVAPGTFDLMERDSKLSFQKPDELTSIQ